VRRLALLVTGAVLALVPFPSAAAADVTPPTATLTVDAATVGSLQVAATIPGDASSPDVNALTLSVADAPSPEYASWITASQPEGPISLPVTADDPVNFTVYIRVPAGATDGPYPFELAVRADGNDVGRVKLTVVVTGGKSGCAPASPALSLEEATFADAWSESRQVGRLVVSGSACAAGDLKLLLREQGGRKLSLPLHIKLAGKGRFQARLALRPGFLPGKYALTFSPPPGVPAPPGQQLVLPPPPEGVMRSAWWTAARDGSAVTKLVGTYNIIYAHFRFQSLPRPALPLSARFYFNGGVAAGPPIFLKRAGLSYVAQLNGRPLRSGLWTCVFRADDTVVGRVALRIQ
jgi:hypothetical protein